MDEANLRRLGGGGDGASAPSPLPPRPSEPTGPVWASSEYLQTGPRGSLDPAFSIVMHDTYVLDLRARIALELVKSALQSKEPLATADWSPKWIVAKMMETAQHLVSEFQDLGWALPTPPLKDLVKETQIARTMQAMADRSVPQDH